MADDQGTPDQDATPLKPEELDNVAGGAFDAFVKIDGATESFDKLAGATETFKKEG